MEGKTKNKAKSNPSVKLSNVESQKRKLESLEFEEVRYLWLPYLLCYVHI